MAKIVILGFVVVLGLGMVTVITSAQEVSPCTVQVQPGESLQGVIDHAPAGAVICIPAGTWTGAISITKSLTLRGTDAGKTVIIGKKEWMPAIAVTSPTNVQTVSVTIAKMTISGSGDGIGGNGNVHLNITDCSLSANRSTGLNLQGAARADLTGCILTGNFQGVIAVDSSWVTITSSTVSKNKNTGIKLMGNAYVEISNSTISDNFYGAEIETSNDADISNTTFSGNQFDGMDIYGSPRVTITGCEVSGSGRNGIAIGNTANVSITDCTISGNATTGILLDASAIRAVVSGCTVSGSKTGIRIADSARVKIATNRIINNGYGVKFVVTQRVPSVTYAYGSISGSGNVIPGPGAPDGNTQAALSPPTGYPWPNGFVRRTAGGS